MQIGQVAEKAGLSLRTVRYYEEVGLVQPISRTPGGFRLYSEREVERLRILKGMHPFGISLEEIRELMELLDRTEDTATVPSAKRDEIAGRLNDFAARADERIVKLEGHIAEVAVLRARMRQRVARLRD